MEKHINNFDRIIKHLEFNSSDDFYMLQIIKRRKENPEIGVNSICLRTIYIDSLEKLSKLKNDIIESCDRNKARAYINLSRKSYRKCTLQMLKAVTDRVISNDYSKPYHIFDSVAGQCGSDRPVWVVDVDRPEGYSDEEFESMIQSIIEVVNQCKPDDSDGKIIDILDTRNGKHILTKPFNLITFSTIYRDIDVHKNNPTILYC